MKMKKKYMGGGMNKPRMTYRMGGLSKAQSREMDQDNDGDIDAQDLAMLRKAKHGMKMEYGHGGKNEYGHGGKNEYGHGGKNKMHSMEHGGKNKMYSMEHGGEMMKRTGFMEMGSKMPKFKMGEDDTMDALIIMQEGGVPLKKKTIPQEGAEMPERERAGTEKAREGVGNLPVETRDQNAEERQKDIDLLEKFAQEYREEFEAFIKKANEMNNEMREENMRSDNIPGMYDPADMRGRM
jgi:hypothetical protein